MTTEVQNELDAFNRYIAERCGGSLNGHTLEEAVQEFREYQRELAEVRAKVQEAIESSEREGSRPLNDEEFWARANARLDAKGIPE